ncbi:MAG TPA: fumarylacetoacetate hydrolase family protein [Pyrinomonadaceae bacterium]|nr:fumarylacetoacetate hydrolase family protein [Pyrinomonadaceae bacterium]
MRLFSFAGGTNQAGNREPRVGILLDDGERLLHLCAAADAEGARPPAPSDPMAWFDLDGVWWPQALALYESLGRGGAKLKRAEERGLLVARRDVRLLAPVPRPGKLICIGLNYRDHAAESNMAIPESPVVFSKFTTAVTGPNEPVMLPAASAKVDYEAELAFVIGRRAKNVTRERAMDHVLGYTMVNDVSARDLQFADGQWQRGKSCDTFAPMGECIVTTDEIPDPHRLRIKLRLNGHTMQDSSTDQLIFGIPELVAFLSETITLEPGDVIATGTPPGVGFARKPPVFLKDGDVMEVEVEGLGVLTNPVVAAARQ